MNWLLPDPTLPRGESIIWRKPASLSMDARSAERRGTIGGTLYLTENTIIFQSNKINPKRLRGQRNYPLAGILRIDVLERTGTLYDGGMRRRMRLACADGSAVLFIVRDLDEVIAFLSPKVGNDGSARGGSVAEQP